MKVLKSLLLGMCVALCACTSQTSTVQTNDKGTQWEWKNGTIIVKTPERPAGQQSVIGLTAPKMEVVRVGFVGLGMRGPGAVERFTHIPGTQIVALCDYEQSRAEGCQKYLQKASLPKAAVYSGEKGYEELCKRDDIDLVYIATDWLHHFPVAMCAMENGKHVAIEVPSAMNLQECWDLINMSEKTRKHCMILENCCYDWFEMNTLNMAQQGVFGEVIRGQGAYIHELSPFWDHYWKNGENDKLGWRLDYNKKHRGDVYATHGLGPVAQAFDIHRGDRMVTLVAMDTKSFFRLPGCVYDLRGRAGYSDRLCRDRLAVCRAYRQVVRPSRPAGCAGKSRFFDQFSVVFRDRKGLLPGQTGDGAGPEKPEPRERPAP